MTWLLPQGVTTLECLVAQGRQTADQRLWAKLAGSLTLVDTRLLLGMLEPRAWTSERPERRGPYSQPWEPGKPTGGENGQMTGVDVNVEEMLDRLGAVIGPPPADGVVPVPWELGPETLGFQLPADYRAFADRYGTISIRGELHIYTPSAAPGPKPEQPLGFEGFLYNTTDPYGYCAMLAQAYRDEDYDECPYPLFPAEGGLLKWGNNWNSDHFFWLMRGPDPDRWPVAAKFDSMREWDLFEGGFLEFLLVALTEQYPYHGDVVPGGTKQVGDGRAYRPWGDWSEQLWQ